MSWGAVALSVLPLPALRALEALAAEAGGWSGAPGKANYRVEGLAKVLGKKIYARDFQARDLSAPEDGGWPATQRVGLVLRAHRSDARLEAIDLSALPPELQPLQLITEAKLKADGVGVPDSPVPPPQAQAEGRATGLMVDLGELPAYLGQPVAILIFQDTASWAAAKRALQFQVDAVLRWTPVEDAGAYTQPYVHPYYMTLYPGPGGGVAFSQTLYGPTDPTDCPDPPTEATENDCLAREVRARIQQELDSAEAQGWTVYAQEAATQVLDPMFMEPEAGLAWFEPKSKHLRLVLGTQSPNGDLSDALGLFSDARGALQVAEVTLTSCYPGGGFGGRDSSTFPGLLTIAAVYAGEPVRLINDRFEQFQSGLKQLGMRAQLKLAVDADGVFQAIQGQLAMEAGGNRNYSIYVAELAAYSASGAYRIPRAAVDAWSQPSFGVVAGSMRGFGGPQALFALEMLVEQVARERGEDPIALRRKNALLQARRDTPITGAPLLEPLPIVEICDAAAKSPLWTQRAKTQKEKQAQGLRYGVGFALANQAFGTGSDGVMAALTLDPDGGLSLHTNAVDMGNGAATTLVCVVAESLGRNAERVHMGEAAMFQDAMYPKAKEDGWREPHARKRSHVGYHRLIGHPVPCDPPDDPTETLSFSMSSSACITAFHQVHAARMAAQVFYEAAVWPAAATLWDLPPEDEAAMQAARWVEGSLTLDGQEALSWDRLVAAMRAGGLVGAMIHAVFQGAWVTASYPLEPLLGFAFRPQWPIDGLALMPAGGSWQAVLRQDTQPLPEHSCHFGRSLYAPSGTLAAVEVDPSTGEVRVLSLHTWLDAGPVLQPELLEGMYQGGAAMGVGYALLEDLPLDKDGAGVGRWNLNRYKVALSRHLPLHDLALHLMPPATPDTASKGIAEAVLCPIAPAIAAAVNAALGASFSTLPITPKQIRGFLGGAR